jgi:hypothetical protein
VSLASSLHRGGLSGLPSLLLLLLCSRCSSLAFFREFGEPRIHGTKGVAFLQGLKGPKIVAGCDKLGKVGKNNCSEARKTPGARKNDQRTMPFKSLRRDGRGETREGKELVRPGVSCSPAVPAESPPAYRREDASKKLKEGTVAMPDCREEAARKLEEENAALLEQIRQLELEHEMLDRAGESSRVKHSMLRSASHLLIDKRSVMAADTPLRTDSGTRGDRRLAASD